MTESVAMSRRDVVAGGAALAVGALSAGTPAAAQSGSFDITRTFAGFMKDIGGTMGDAGGKVTTFSAYAWMPAKHVH